MRMKLKIGKMAGLRKEVNRECQEVFPKKGIEEKEADTGLEADPKYEKTDPEVVRENIEGPDGIREAGQEAVTDILEVGLEALIEDREKDHLKRAEMK